MNTKRYLIVFLASVVVAFVATVIAVMLDSDYEPYYPHDDRLYQEKTQDGIDPGME